MRSTDERIADVRRRSRRLSRRRGNRVLVALVCLMALPLIDLAGRRAMGNEAVSRLSGDGLFGTSSLFGPSVGGYVLVAVATAAIAVAVTALIITRRKTKREEPVPEHSEETTRRES